MNSRLTAITQFNALIEELEVRTGGVKYLSEPGLSRQCPKAGLYFFFDERAQHNGVRPRVVRIGTHALTSTSKSTLWGRLRQHRGNMKGSNPDGGSHRGSIFRHHMGTALLNQRADEALLRSWRSKQALPDFAYAERELEVEVSRIIRAMPFLWLSVPTRKDGTSDRAFLERNLIALLSTANGDVAAPDPQWLGHYASAIRIRESSLWNVKHVYDDFDSSSLESLRVHVRDME